MFDILTIGVFVGALALLIMSAIIWFSAKGLVDQAAVKANEDALTKAKNIRNTGMILLGISLAVVLVYGIDMYKQYSAGKAGSSVSYYF